MGTGEFDRWASICHESHTPKLLLPPPAVCNAIHLLSSPSPCSPKLLSQSRQIWWYLFAESRNAISMLWDCFSLQPVFSLFSDTSGSLGCGAFWGSQWFHLQQLAHFQPLSIAVKELVPVIIAAVLFGSQWRGYLIQFSMDNMNVVHVLNSTYSKDPHLMHMFHTFQCSWQLTSIFGSGLSTLKEGPTAWQTHCPTLLSSQPCSWLFWEMFRIGPLPTGLPCSTTCNGSSDSETFTSTPL